MPEVTVINARKAASLLRQAVKVKGGDHVQEGGTCVYVVNEHGQRFRGEAGETPAHGCLVGTALALEVGLPVLVKRLVNNGYNRDPLNLFAANLPDMIGVRLTKKAEAMFTAAQKHQDSQESWSSALEKALEV